MNTSFTVDLSEFNHYLFLVPEVVKRGALRGIAMSLSAIQKYARKNHRFINQSGRRPSGRYYRNTHMLEKSISMDRDESGGMVYLDTGIAKYGPYVHEGQRSWEPDQFIYEAFEKEKEHIQPNVEEQVRLELARI